MRIFVAIVVALIAFVAPAAAQDLPKDPSKDLPKSIKIIVPFPAGGTTDILARFVAQALEKKHGVTVIIDNRAGASGTIGSQAVAASPADGSVLLLTATHHVINPSIQKNLPYDTRAAFSPVALIATAPNALFVSKDFPAKDVRELIAKAKAEPGKLSFASTGVGGANHLSGELFKQMAGIDIVHIPYKGAAPAMNDLIGGHVPIMFDSLPTVLPAASAGTIRVLAVTSAERSPSLPDVPTLDEAGVKGFELIAWFGLYMPQAGNSPGLCEDGRGDAGCARRPLHHREVREPGSDTGKVFGADFTRFVDAEITKWGGVVKASGMQPQD